MRATIRTRRAPVTGGAKALPCQPYRQTLISAGQWESGYLVTYRPMLDRWSFAPSASILLVVPAPEESH